MSEEAARRSLGAKRPATQLVAEFAVILTLPNEKTPGQWAGGFFDELGCGGTQPPIPTFADSAGLTPCQNRSHAGPERYAYAAVTFKLRIWGSGVRISSGAPLPNKTGHSGWTTAAGRNEPFQDTLTAPNADFVVVDLDLVDN
jgi:hypothetical protein